MIIHTFTSLFVIADMTASEWVAIILHEIGHNFYNSHYIYIINKMSIIYGLIRLFKLLIDVVGNPLLLKAIIDSLVEYMIDTTSSGRKIVTTVKKIVVKYDLLSNASSIITKIVTILQDAMTFPLTAIGMISIALGIALPKIPAEILLSTAQLPSTIIFKRYK